MATPTMGTTGDLCAKGPMIAEADFPASFANAICGGRELCGCPSANCVSTVTASLMTVAMNAQSKGFDYSPDCAAGWLATLNAHLPTCSHRSIGCGFSPCRVYSGHAVNGAECQHYSDVYTGDCAGTLECGFSEPTFTCVEGQLPAVQVDDPCFDANIDWFIGECPDGAFCDSGASDKCIPNRVEGDMCVSGRCGGNLYCSVDNQCVAQKDVGVACDSLFECATLECTNGVCTSTPWVCSNAWGAD